MQRFPRGYRGIRHETIGSDILSVLEVLMLPEHLLGKERVQAIRTMKPDGWYDITVLLDILETLSAKTGERSLINIGWSLFRLSHAKKFRQNVTSVRQFVFGCNGLYLNANRGEDIGGWRVLAFEPGRALLENTTPHHCMLEEGILDEALRVLGIPAVITQETCFRKGADCCHFLLSSHVKDQRWMGPSPTAR